MLKWLTVGCVIIALAWALSAVAQEGRQMTRDGLQGTGDMLGVSSFCVTPQDIRVLATRVAEDGAGGFNSVMADPTIRCFSKNWPGHNYWEPIDAVLVARVLETVAPDGTTIEFWSMDVQAGTLQVGGSWTTRIYSWRRVSTEGA